MSKHLLSKFISDDVLKDLVPSILELIPEPITSIIGLLWSIYGSFTMFSNNSKTVGPFFAFLIAIEGFLPTILTIVFELQALIEFIAALFSFSWIKISLALSGLLGAIGSYYLLGIILAVFPMSTIVNFFFSKSEKAQKIQEEVFEFIEILKEIDDKSPKINSFMKNVENISTLNQDGYYYKAYHKGLSFYHDEQEYISHIFEKTISSLKQRAGNDDQQSISTLQNILQQINQNNASTIESILSTLQSDVAFFEEQYSQINQEAQSIKIKKLKANDARKLLRFTIQLQTLLDEFEKKFNKDLLTLQQS